MSTVSTALKREAESIFTSLGYTVTPDDDGMRAERKWRVVRVTPMAEPAEPPTSGDLHCFVTFEDCVSSIKQTLTRENPDYDWAIIGIRDDGYVVSHQTT